MSKASRDFFEDIKQGKETSLLQIIKEGALAVAPGLGNILGDVKAELGRLGVQGQMELASAIFGNGAFVPYGPGQYTPSPEHGLPKEAAKQQEPQEQENSRGGRDM